MTLSLAVAIKNAELTSYGANCNGGTIQIYAGAVPASADTALTGQTVLGSPAFSATAFGAAAAGSMSANPFTQPNAVGTSGADLNLVSTSIVAGEPIEITSFVRSM